MSRTARAFTIIELLVVIAVIGVLSAILLPAVSNVRRTAARTQDQSNQRQLVLGAINYADTRKGQIMSGNTQREVYLGGNSQYLRNKLCDAWVNANPSNPDLDGDGFGDYFIPLDEDQCVLTESPFAIEEGVLSHTLAMQRPISRLKIHTPEAEATRLMAIWASSPTLTCLKKSSMARPAYFGTQPNESPTLSALSAPWPLLEKSNKVW